MKRIPLCLLSLALLSCDEPTKDDTGSSSGPTDADKDGYTTVLDCDDANPDVNPGAEEIPYDGLDNDCDESTPDDDLDDDGYASTATGGQDCDDSDPSIHPGANEVCDGVDQDCDGVADDSAGERWYADEDGDTWGDAGDSVNACDGASGYVSNDRDCDDSDDAIHPGAGERCDGVDEDCDGVVDDNPVDGDTWYLDADHDGYGDPDASMTACTAPSGYVAEGGDCNDASAAVNPAAAELCDTRDNDCDGFVDEADAEDAATWYMDADADGYGDPGAAIPGCVAPTGAVADSTDCDDSDASVNPGATEIWYDGVDQDCAGDDDLDADADGDRAQGYGGGDCDEADPTIHSAATEVYYDGVDQDCDGLSDYDADVDGYDSDAYDGDDCDDTSAAIYPGAPEADAGVDNDCDGEAELMPVADADYDTTSLLTHCQALLLDGGASYDPDGTALTYAWQVLGHPSGSTTGTSDFDDPTSATPTIYPDLPGDYDFSLTVTDEGDAAATDILTVTIGPRVSNSAPVADAGADESASATATCAAVGWGYTGEYTCDTCDDLELTLDASASSDADGEPMSYLWTVTSGDGSLRHSTTSTPTLTVTGPTPEYGASATETVEVEVEVTDCFGDVSTDEVVVTYECVGE